MNPYRISLSRFIACFIFTTSLSSFVLGQTDTTTTTGVWGVVLDAKTKGKISDATVILRNTSIDWEESRKTNAQGEFTFGLLPPAPYEFEVEAKGYQKVLFPPAGQKRFWVYKQAHPNRVGKPDKEISIPSNKTTHNQRRQSMSSQVVIFLASYKPEASSETFPITSPGIPHPPQQPSQEEPLRVLVNTENATRNGYADEQQLTTLPLSGIRAIESFAFLSPGAASPPATLGGTVGPGIGAGIGTAGQFSVNGQRARSNNFTIDGSDNNDEDVGVRRQGYIASTPQTIESIQEFYIATHLWEPWAGRNVGSQVDVISKSGTKDLHSTLYDFFNHHNLNARNFFDYTSDKNSHYPLQALAVDRYSNGAPINPRFLPVKIDGQALTQPNPSRGKDQYQRNQGGGILSFPLWKKHTFFFGSFERQDIKAQQETHFAVPTVAQRGFLGFGTTGLTAVDTQGIQRVLPPTSPAGDAVFSLFPFPNNPIGPYTENTYTQVLSANGSANIFSVKVDHNFR
jgi:hypothetical protein